MRIGSRRCRARIRWAAYDVRIHTTGVKRFHHPVVGDLDLSFESFATSHDALNLLATWAASTDNIEPALPNDDPEPAEAIETPD